MPIICKECQVTKLESSFYRQRGAISGRMSSCKECVKERAAAYRAANLERVREYDRLRGNLPHRKEAVKARAHKYEKKNLRLMYPEHSAASDIVNHYLRDGIIRRPIRCERCGSTERQPQAHHDDYRFPLAITWLCPSCHGEVHREINAQRRMEAA